jgi:branched-chain amino acid transport system substrate-binding protein
MKPPIATRRTLLATAGASLTLGIARPARAQDAPIRIGVLTDLSGSFSDDTGRGSVLGATMAVEDFHAQNPGLRAEVVFADTQGKPDVAAGVARNWLDRDGIDAIADVPQSAAALAIATILADRNMVGLFSGPGTAELTGKACSPNHVQWTYDTWTQAASLGGALVAEGHKTWSFITADYAFGKAMASDTARFVQNAGGRVLSNSPFPFPGTSDFSSYLLTAQASGASIIALCTAGTETINCVKQADEFGIGRDGKQSLAALLFLVTTVHSLGLPIAQGLLCSEPFYWDLNDGTRAFSARFAPRNRETKPTMVHAATYSAVLHYLKAVAAMGAAKAKADGRATITQMKAMPTDDPLFGQGTIRSDGRKLHDTFIFEVKKPAESRYPWDYYRQVRRVPAADCIRPLNEGACPFVKT